VAEGANLNFVVSASDPDGTTPTLTTSTLPANATFVDNANGTGTFDFNPGFLQAGAYPVTFYATDGFATDSQQITITVTDAGNQPPHLAAIATPQTVYETATLNINVSATDPDGTIPALSATGVPVNGTFVDHADGTGTFSFTPAFGQVGSYPVTFKAFDGVVVDSQVITITVLHTNRPPVLAAIGAQSVTEGQTLTVNATATDPDGTIPTLTTSALPANAAFVDHADGTGTLTFTPDFTQAGSFTVRFYASDGVAIDSQIVGITVADAGNQRPVLATIGPRTAVEGTTLSINVTATDPDAQIPVLTIVNLPTNATFVDNHNGTGSFAFTPSFTQSGVYGVTFIASDGVLADSELVLITVSNSGNLAPVIDSIGPQLVLENDSLILNLHATDPNGDSLFFSYTTTKQIHGLQLVDNHNGTAVLRFYPDYKSSGVDTIKIVASDNGTPHFSTIMPIQITVFEVNQPPVIDSIGPFGTRVGRTLQFTVTAHDSTAPQGSALYLSASNMPANASFTDNGSGSGTFSFTPIAGQTGQFVVRFTAIDNGSPAMSASRDVRITVVATNNPPVIATIGPKMVVEGQVLTFTVSAVDPDGSIVILSAQNLPPNATFADNLNGTGIFTFSPTFTQSGLYSVIIRATDGIDNAKQNVLIQVVDAGNQPPVISPITSQTITEAQALTFNVTSTDPDGTIPSLSIGNLPNHATFTDNHDGTGSMSWTPGYTQQGVYNLLLIASDGSSADTITVTVTVIDAGNQAPKLDPITNVNGKENHSILFTIHAVDADSVIPILSTSPLPTGATFTDNQNYTGTFSWTPGFFQAGTYNIRFYAMDRDSSLLVDSLLSVIIVADSNRLPRMLVNTSQTLTVNEGDSLTFYVLANDPDSTFPTMSYFPAVPNFTIRDSISGSDVIGIFKLKPNYTQSGTYYIRFAAHDGDPRYPNDSAIAGGTTGIQFTVNNVNAPPVLSPIGPQTVVEGATLSVTISASDPGGDAVNILAANMPANATLSGFGAPKLFRFIPNYVQAGTYDVTFYATDGTLADTEIVHITVTEAGNQAPRFNRTLFPDTQTVIIGNVVTNHIVATDPDLDPMVLSMVSPPANVVFVDSGNGAGSMVFTPNSTQVGGTYIFRYVARDPSNAADTMFKYIRPVSFLRGDVNGDNRVNIADISYLIDYVFRSGQAPVTADAADANNDRAVNVSDAIYLVNYIFRFGPPPANN